jgi:hypothetical protein
MITFLEHTWILWWALASVVVLRWFHQAYNRSHGSADEAPEPEDANLPGSQDALFYWN